MFRPRIFSSPHGKPLGPERFSRGALWKFVLVFGGSHCFGCEVEWAYGAQRASAVAPSASSACLRSIAGYVLLRLSILTEKYCVVYVQLMFKAQLMRQDPKQQ